MKIVAAYVTEEDLKASVWNPFGCPAFRAINRVVPSVSKWLFSRGYINHDTSEEIEVFAVNDMELTKRLFNHSTYQYNPEENKADKQEPFSFQIEVPDDTPVNQ